MGHEVCCTQGGRLVRAQLALPQVPSTHQGHHAEANKAKIRRGIGIIAIAS